jgi:glycosyltransferase involved in cell wall biosynthesis
MHFGPSNATSIDLCVYDLVSSSRYRASTTILCAENETIFSDLDVCLIAPSALSARKRLAVIQNHIQRYEPDLIVVQQHLPTAVNLARAVHSPVILHSHNMPKSFSHPGVIARLRKMVRARAYQALSGIIFVSEAARASFETTWPASVASRAVVPNGTDFAAWRPRDTRKREILCVGRAVPEKGIREAALAVADVLARRPAWRGLFILSETDTSPQYFQEVQGILGQVGRQVDVLQSQPWSVVKEHFEAAAIALVPSKWQEPFGRTALEAHAGCCAVVTSGTGGLKEISGPHAVYLPPNFSDRDISVALSDLVDDEQRRRQLALEGRAYCKEHYDLGKVASAADAYYQTVLDESKFGRTQPARRCAGKVRTLQNA